MFSSANPILNKKGKITGFLTIQRDLTERKRIEKELVEREKRYRKVSELVSDYAYSTRFKPDGSKLLEWVTDSFTKIFGFTLEEASDRSIWEKQHYPEDLPIIEERLQRLLSNEEVISEYRLITRDGDVKWVRDYGYPEWDEGENRVVGVYGAVQDITERKRMEEEVQGLARFPSENTSPVMRISNDGVIMYVNDASKSLLNEWNTEIGSAVPEEWRHYVSKGPYLRIQYYPDHRFGLCQRLR
jgi:PAS domain S-box-containing protein